MLSLVVWHKWLFSNPKLFTISSLMPLGYLLISTYYLPNRFDALCTHFPFWKHWALRNHKVQCWSGIHFERQHNFKELVSHFKYEKWKLYNELEKGSTFMKLEVIFSSWKWHYMAKTQLGNKFAQEEITVLGKNLLRHWMRLNTV